MTSNHRNAPAKSVLCGSLLAIVACLAFAPSRASAQGAAALVRLLKGGRLPAERVPAIVDTICQRGETADLAFVFEQARSADARWSIEARLKALDGLAQAAKARKLQPKVDQKQLAALFDDENVALRAPAVRLAGAWQATDTTERLQALACDVRAAAELRLASLDSLVQFGAEATRPAADKLLSAEQPLNWRIAGVAALAGVDLTAAAPHAAESIGLATAEADLEPLLAAFVGRQGGGAALAAALKERPPSRDCARLALRAMYALGQNNADLSAVLDAAAGISGETRPLSPAEVQALAAEALAKGAPARGERIFRRAELNCFKCHALSGAGGNVGPDLSAVGSTSPADYVVNSLLFPDLAIKEAFVTRIVQTVQGSIHQGIVLDRSDTRLVLKDATGQRVEIAVADIEEEAEGKSLMPKGLTNFLTHAEFLDLVSFVSTLGKPGEYAIRSRPTVQRWRVLASTPADLAAAPLDASLPARLPTDAAAWSPAYAEVAGQLPWGELVSPERPVLFLRAEIEMTEPGAVQAEFGDASGVAAWLGGSPLDPASPAPIELPRGMHALWVRIDPAQAAPRGTGELRVVIEKPPGSSAQYTVVAGP